MTATPTGNGTRNHADNDTSGDIGDPTRDDATDGSRHDPSDVSSDGARRVPVVLGPGEGRAFPMGPVSAVFKADGAETADRYSISEWWLEPHTKGPGAHSHPEDDVFYVLAGTMSVRVDTEWFEAGAGSFVLVPGGTTHDFENRSAARAGMLNVSAPGDFEQHMPGIAQWFRERSPADART